MITNVITQHHKHPGNSVRPEHNITYRHNPNIT